MGGRRLAYIGSVNRGREGGREAGRHRGRDHG